MQATPSNVFIILFFIVVWGLIVFAMYKGWKKRGATQLAWIGDLPEPPKKTGPVRIAPSTGLYIGSAFAENWQARVGAHGLGSRAAATLAGYPNGVLLEREGSAPLWIPRKSIVEVRTDKRLAGKVMTEDGLLVIRWHPPASNDASIEIDTGFRGDDKSVYPQWIKEFDSAQGGNTPGNQTQGREASK